MVLLGIHDARRINGANSAQRKRIETSRVKVYSDSLFGKKT